MREQILNLVETILPLGIGAAARNLLEECHVLAVHVPNTLKGRLKFHHATGLRVQLGCGPRLKPGWVNIDLRRGSDLRLDLRRPLPFPDRSCQFIYSEHFFEHLEYPHYAEALLRECMRVLEPDGTLSVVVPDIELVMRSYVNGGSPEYYEAQRRWHPSWYRTQVEHINFNFRQDGEHRFAYDYETLSLLLHKLGFTDVQRRAFDPALDSEDRLVGSLYVRARRP